MARWRWMPSTVFPNLWGYVEDTYYGLRNVIRWAPVIWWDADFDWAFIAVVLEYKLRRHAKLELTVGHHTNSTRDGKRMLVCAELLKRLQANRYMDDRNRFPADPNCKRVQARQRGDQRYLGHLLGKHFTSWWD